MPLPINHSPSRTRDPKEAQMNDFPKTNMEISMMLKLCFAVHRMLLYLLSILILTEIILGGTEAISFTGDHTRTQNLALQLSKNVALSKLPLFSHP